MQLKDCPSILNTPVEMNPLTGEVTYEHKTTPNIENVYDDYDESFVPLKAILDQVFYEHGRVRPHERILCWFPKYLQYF